MSVIPSHYNLLNNKQELKKFILDCQNNLSVSHQAEIISISTEIQPIDPLAFLAIMKQPNELSFYWENQRKQESVVALGSVKTIKINEGNRFFQSQEFIEYYQSKITQFGDLEINNFPYFFCYFTFFNEVNNYNNCFPLANIFIPYLQLVNKEDKSVLVINTLSKQKLTNTELLDKYFNNENINNFNGNKGVFQLNHVKKDNELTREVNDSEYKNFTLKVNKALTVIKQKKLSKIVITHALELTSNKDFKVIESLANLREKHPDCYVFSVSNNEEDYFIGASPERLLSIQEHQLVTDALAGSAPRGKSDFEDQFFGEKLLNSEKERREHDAVSDFLIKRLSQLELSPKKASLQLLKLSNIQHLWTPIYAQIHSTLKPLKIISKLHPTPAVAGVPIDMACEEIKTQENFDRSLYAAPLGWIDINGNCEFIVGIRSALIQGNKARLYAGAGIVAGSNPQQELTEIKLKFQALLQALI